MGDTQQLPVVETTQSTALPLAELEQLAALQRAAERLIAARAEGSVGTRATHRPLDQWWATSPLTPEQTSQFVRLAQYRAVITPMLRQLVQRPDAAGAEQTDTDALLRYLEDFSNAEMSAMLRTFDRNGDGRFDEAEGQVAHDGIARILERFERTEGLDLDLNGVVDQGEMSFFLESYALGRDTADLNRDGAVDARDMQRLSGVGPR